MLDSTTRRRWLFSSLTGTLAAGTMAAAGGCGSILFPERVGQPRSGPIDWRVVALDGVGLVFFFVPGVVAFAIDFYNGTLFLPSHSVAGIPTDLPTGGAPSAHQSLQNPTTESLESVALPPGPERREKVEEIITARVGQPVLLEPGSYQTQPLDHIEEFWSALRATAGLPVQPA